MFLLCLWCKVNESPLRRQQLTKCKARSCEQAVWVLKRPLRTLLFSNVSPRSPSLLPPHYWLRASHPNCICYYGNSPPLGGRVPSLSSCCSYQCAAETLQPKSGRPSPRTPVPSCHRRRDKHASVYTHQHVRYLDIFLIAQLGRNCLCGSTCNFQRLWMTVFCQDEGVRVERVFQEVLKRHSVVCFGLLGLNEHHLLTGEAYGFGICEYQLVVFFLWVSAVTRCSVFTHSFRMWKEVCVCRQAAFLIKPNWYAWKRADICVRIWLLLWAYGASDRGDGPFFPLLMRGPLWGRAPAVRRGWGPCSAFFYFINPSITL